MTVHGLFGLLVYELCIKLYCGVHEAGMAIGFWVHNVEPMLDDWQ